jgi:alpha-D-ribose 1-methylphosphonate 5-triphosphate synthase subunit PhnG
MTDTKTDPSSGDTTGARQKTLAILAAASPEAVAEKFNQLNRQPLQPW